MNDGARHIRPYNESDQQQVEWLYSRTPPAGQVSARPQVMPIVPQEIPTYYGHFVVAIEIQRGEEVVVGMAGIEEVGAAAIQPWCLQSCGFRHEQHAYDASLSRLSVSAQASDGCWSKQPCTVPGT